MEYYNLISAVFFWSLQLMINILFFIIIFEGFLPSEKYNSISMRINYPIIIGQSLKNIYTLEIKGLICLTSNFLGFDIDL